MISGEWITRSLIMNGSRDLVSILLLHNGLYGVVSSLWNFTRAAVSHLYMSLRPHPPLVINIFSGRYGLLRFNTS